jgi:hypothetical protein
LDDDVQTHAQVEDLHMPSDPTPHEHLLSPIPIGPKGDLDWLRFSFLVRNNQLSFDDIAELVTKTTPDTNKCKQQNLLTVILPDVRDCISHHQSSGWPGKPSEIFEYDVSPLEEEPPRPFSNVIGLLEREGREVGFGKKLSGDTVREDEDENEINWTTHRSQALPELDHVQDDISSVSETDHNPASRPTHRCVLQPKTKNVQQKKKRKRGGSPNANSNASTKTPTPCRRTNIEPLERTREGFGKEGAEALLQRSSWRKS